MAAHYGPQPVFAHCLHRHVRVIHNGQRTFYEGEVFDNIQEQVPCLDCFQTLTEEEVRATWNARSICPQYDSASLDTFNTNPNSDQIWQ